MNRLGLRRFIGQLALAAPLASGGCLPCPGVAQNYYELAPDGGIEGDPAVGTVLPEAQCQALCGWSETDAGLYPHPIDSARMHQCRAWSGDGGSLQIYCQGFTSGSCGTGRRPAGLAQAQVGDGSALGRYFATMAHLEAASVGAFEILAAELRTHRAPERLVAAAEQAARDEVRHARITGALARRHGAEVPAVERANGATRSLREVALENAAEGCVRETFGAVVCRWQAEHAGDRAIRRAMGALAGDEARHAELAWAVDAWARSRLGSEERAELRQVKRATAAQLHRESHLAPAPALIAEAGVPAVEVALALAEGARRALWT